MTSRSLLFWCCKPLGLRCLHVLIEKDVNIVGVYVAADDPTAAQIVEVAQRNHIPVLPDQFLPTADLGLIVGYPQKISGECIRSCKDGIVNLHFAPLPQYRGSKTLARAIIKQEKTYGITLHFIDEHLDTGPIISVATIPLRNATTLELRHDIEELAYKHFSAQIPLLIHAETIKSTPQQELIATQHIVPHFCTRQEFYDLHHVSLTWSFEKLERYVRAFTDGSNEHAYVEENGRRIYLIHEEMRHP